MGKNVKDEIENVKNQMLQLEETAQKYRDKFKEQADACIEYYETETQKEIEYKKQKMKQEKRDLQQILKEAENKSAKEILESLRKVYGEGKE